MLKRILIAGFIVCMAGSLLYGQSADETPQTEIKPKFNFDMGIIIGLTSYEDIDGVQEGYQKLVVNMIATPQKQAENDTSSGTQVPPSQPKKPGKKPGFQNFYKTIGLIFSFSKATHQDQAT